MRNPRKNQPDRNQCFNKYIGQPKVKYAHEQEIPANLLGKGMTAYVCHVCGYAHVGHDKGRR